LGKLFGACFVSFHTESFTCANKPT
jgi:hypothetical protein